MRRAIVLLALLVVPSVARAERPRTGYVVIDPGEVTNEPLTGGAPTIFYINKNGGQYRASNYNDSRTNYSTIVSSGISTVPAWNVSATGWNTVKSCVVDMFSRFNVTITDVDPGNTPHFEIVIAGSPEDVGMDQGVGGVSPFTNDCSVIDNSIVYVFAEVYGNDYQGVCETAAQEVAHSIGLDHEYLCQDPMTYLFNCGDKTFQDVDAPCGEYSDRACYCNGNTQNSVQMLYDRIGPATGTSNEAPTVSITSPNSGDTVPPQFGVAADASDDSGVTKVEFRVDGTLAATDTSAPYGFQAADSLADGNHTVTATAYDDQGETAQDSITVTQYTPGPGEPDAGPTGNPGEPDAGPGNPGGGDDDDDTGGGGGDDGFITGGCSAGAGGGVALTGLALFGLLALRRRR